jgi:hypothetical protein
VRCALTSRRAAAGCSGIGSFSAKSRKRSSRPNPSCAGSFATRPSAPSSCSTASAWAASARASPTCPRGIAVSSTAVTHTVGRLYSSPPR